MLEIKNLTKTYRSKTGESVKALDNVSLSFPETGMVFILGKSGSGKSTLLNVIGGLDSYDSGEFIIKGKSSKDFAGSDFDAYRNTFIGFIFQEYNVLDDFTVGANIGLALELQGKKATDEKINGILAQVDLLNYAKRKPNELSGGQKQRVAIARALVKDPQIIMADEPTGALDSNTGKQIFDTLKELSREKLVLIVSHDRDFAERYADRIVELSDGKILSDVTKHEHKSVQLSEGIQQINDRILRIKGGYRLTENDLKMINDYLQANQSDIILSGDGRINDELRSAAGISAEGNTSVFEDTAEPDVKLKSYEKKDSKFIRSSLPIKNALKIGASGLKHKKFRLVMTIFLSLIAFALFGFADTIGTYEKHTAAVSSVMDSGIKNASVSLGVKRTVTYNDEEPYSYHNYALMNDKDIAYLREQTGLDFVPVFTSGDEWNPGVSVSQHFKTFSNSSVLYTGKIMGFVHMTDAQISNANLRLTSGRLPQKDGEIAITDLMLRQMNEFGFINQSHDEEILAGKVTAQEILQKHLTINSGMLSADQNGMDFTIVGIIDTGFDYDRYQSLLPAEENEPNLEEGNALATMVLTSEAQSELRYGFHMLCFARENDIDQLVKSASKVNQNLGQYMNGWNSETFIVFSSEDDSSEGDKESMDMMYHQNFHQLAGSDVIDQLDIVWTNGTPLTSLKEKQVILPENAYFSLFPQQITKTVDPVEFEAFIRRLYPDSTAWAETAGSGMTYYERWHQVDPNAEQSLAMARYIADLLELDLNENTLHILSWRLLDRLQALNDENLTIAIDSYEFQQFLRRKAVCEEFQTMPLTEKTALMNKFHNDTGVQWDEYVSEQDKFSNYTDFYYAYLFDGGEGYEENEFGPLSGREMEENARKEFYSLVSPDLSKIKFKRMERDYSIDQVFEIESYELEVVGYYTSMHQSDMLISDMLLADYQEWYKDQQKDDGYSYKETVAEHEAGSWGFAIAPMGDEASLRKLVDMTYDDESDLKFSLQNSVMTTLDSFNEFIEMGAIIFLYVGIGFAVFSALLLMNFISTSISYKKREIGILRAVGAKSSDVFKIFFSEALIIALINFILSLATVIGVITFANTYMRSQGINITLLTFGVRQVALMLLISIAVALVASFLPVYNIAKRKPVDAIKDK